MKKLKKLKGVKVLKKSLLMAINGGGGPCSTCSGPNFSKCYHDCAMTCLGECMSGQCIPY